MDSPEPPADIGAAEWAEITRIVSISLPEDSPEAWLGQLVLEVQRASDRSIAWAQDQAESLVADAEAEAAGIRARALRSGRSGRPAELRDPSGVPPAIPAPPRARVVEPAPVPVPVPAPPAAAPFPPPTLAAARMAGEPAPTVPAPVPATPVPAPAPFVTTASPASALPRRGLVDWRILLAVVAVTAIAFGFVVFEGAGTAVRERRSQRLLVAAFAKTAATRSPGPPGAGGVLGLLDIPHLGISGLAVVEGATLSHLQRGPAHDSNTQLPGQLGAVVLIGHHRTYGGPFARLGDLRIGDLISLRTTSQEYVYRVGRIPQAIRLGATKTYDLPSAAEVAATGGAADHVDQALVLATGMGPDNSRLEVVAATLDQAASDTASALTRPGKASAVLRSVPAEPFGLVPVVLWLMVGASVAFGARMLTHRAPPAVLYPLAAGMAVIATYQMYGALDRLMPGTY